MNSNDAWAARSAAEAIHTQTQIMLQRESDRLQHESEMRKIEEERKYRQRQSEYFASLRQMANEATTTADKLDTELSNHRRRIPAMEQVAVQANLRSEALLEALRAHVTLLGAAVDDVALEESLTLRLAAAARDPQFVAQTQEQARDRVQLEVKTRKEGVA